MLNQTDNFMQVIKVTHPDNPFGLLDILITAGVNIFNINIHPLKQLGDVENNTGHIMGLCMNTRHKLLLTLR